MEFGLFCGGFTPRGLWGLDDPAQAEHERLLSEVELAVLADRTNWKYWWTTEHHFLDEYSHISANEVLLPWVGARTERIHLGSGIFNITPPVNHPARVAERVAMLDHLTEGRFEFGTGRGSSTTEQQGFGIPEPDLTKDMFDEVIGEFRRMWSQRDYSFEGRFFSMPTRNVLPKPWIKPHPPMWVAAGNPGTFEKAARMGLGVLCFTRGSPRELAPLVEIYKTAIADAEPVGEYVNDNVAVVSQFLCLEDREQARDWMVRAGSNYHSSLLYRYLDTFPRPPGVPAWPAVLPPTTRAVVDERIEQDAGVVGNPEDCLAALRQFEAIGCDQVLMGPSSTTWPHDLCAESVELFGKQVIPELDRDPEHRTSRFRREAAAAAS
ncbi:LLM class flavin-dependent oxidoreductase [Rhabdothermincola sp.]|uniref:LLM class flavin-dependent oxidoreductase n=1 Tax=Rhabdothermincola sp. TaxID=2820405 RepID=UPI002FDFDF72